MAEVTTGDQEQSFMKDSGRYWEPIDNQNYSYMEKLTDREQNGLARDFLKEHKVCFITSLSF